MCRQEIGEIFCSTSLLLSEGMFGYFIIGRLVIINGSATVLDRLHSVSHHQFGVCILPRKNRYIAYILCIYTYVSTGV